MSALAGKMQWRLDLFRAQLGLESGAGRGLLARVIPCALAARAMLARDAGAGVDIKSAETLVLGPECRRFSYAELETATNGYPDANVIGEGGFGKVQALRHAG